MLVNRMSPQVEVLVGKGYTHYAYIAYNCERGEATYDENDKYVPAPYYNTPTGERAVNDVDDIMEFAELVGGNLANYSPPEFVAKLEDAGFHENHRPEGVAWSKRHIWVGFNMK